ncbi:uncharacterized protein C18orf63 [Nephila pilipes]|uniref:Uncharacterized protein C18orf63 n=1 Tax=Nephila pilipes TaxID=299642 RepID=A0A8X6QM45_NEPPI|nr:uncharacterized protein C18orf63 [Nephila pilipes]
MPDLLKTFLFFLNTPDLNNLLTLYVNIHSENNPKLRSAFHLKTLKCRELIFKDTNVIACPTKNMLSPIRIIIPRIKLHCPEFKENLKKMELEVIKIEETTAIMLQECLQYTCTAKMAPSWNILQNLLVQGSNFLTTTGPLNAIMQVIGNCHVLPSMKQGKIITISKNPHTTGAFKSYLEIQKHWKDMYGYVLPNESKEGISYYNVTFRIPNASLYTYPQFCVRPYSTTIVPRVNPRLTICSFIKDFCKKIGNIFGEKCRIIDGRASFTNLELFPAIKISEEMKPRAGTTYVMKTDVPFRKDLPSNVSNSWSNAEKSHHDKLNNSNSSSTATLSELKSASSNHSDENNPKKKVNISERYTTSETMKNESLKCISNNMAENTNNLKSAIKIKDSVMTTGTEQKKFAPCFYPIRPKSHHRSVLQNQPTNKKISDVQNFFPNCNANTFISNISQKKQLDSKEKNISKDINSIKFRKISNDIEKVPEDVQSLYRAYRGIHACRGRADYTCCSNEVPTKIQYEDEQLSIFPQKQSLNSPIPSDDSMGRNTKVSDLETRVAIKMPPVRTGALKCARVPSCWNQRLCIAAKIYYVQETTKIPVFISLTRKMKQSTLVAVLLFSALLLSVITVNEVEGFMKKKLIKALLVSKILQGKKLIVLPIPLLLPLKEEHHHFHPLPPEMPPY